MFTCQFNFQHNKHLDPNCKHVLPTQQLSKFDLLVRYYPKGNKKNNKSFQYCSICFRLRDKKTNNKTLVSNFNKVHIAFLCGEKEYKYKSHVQDCIDAQGISKLFPIKYVEKYNDISVHFKLININKKRNLKQLCITDSFEPLTKKQKCNNLVPHSLQNEYPILTDWKFNHFLLDNIYSNIWKNLEKYHSEHQFQMNCIINFKYKKIQEIVPTIDCFATNFSAHKSMKFHINKKQNFFSFEVKEKYNWESEVCWANPPFQPKLLLETLNTFRDRKICGYILGPNYIEFGFLYQKFIPWKSKAKHLMKTCYKINKKENNFIFYHHQNTKIKNQHNKCPYDLICYFFDFSSQ